MMSFIMRRRIGYFGDADPGCYPTWHAQFAPLVGQPGYETVLSSGCGLGAGANVACQPEAMRAAAEQQLQASGLWPAGQPLSMDTYAIARNIQSEVGSSSIEQRVALAETTINQGIRRGLSPAGMVLFSNVAANNGFFGEIQSGASGRFTSSAHDPTILTTLIADFVVSGQSNNFTGGGSDQDGLEYQKYFPNIAYTVSNYANSGMYWVGLLPGVDHWLSAIWKYYGVAANSAQGQQLIQRALQGFANPNYVNGRATNRPQWPADLPICGGGDTIDNSTDMSTTVPGAPDSSGVDPGSTTDESSPDNASGSTFGVLYRYLTYAAIAGGLVFVGYAAYHITKNRIASAMFGRHKRRKRSGKHLRA